MDYDLKTLIVFALLIVAGSSGGNIVASFLNPPRPDPFTGSDAQSMRAFILFELDKLRLEMERQHYDLRQDMPPPATRNRIKDIERWINEQDADFEHEDEW